jgi:hypothetical protein
MSLIHPVIEMTKSAMPTPLMINELTMPQNTKVMASASPTGQAVGSGSFSGLGRFHPGRWRAGFGVEFGS